MDNDKLIGDPTTPFKNVTVDIRIWCISDSLVRKCTLEHVSKDTNHVACEKSIPLSCKQNRANDKCNPSYKNLKAVQTSTDRCEFQFTMISEKGG